MKMVNYLAVLVAAVAAHALGFLWYGPLFGKKWRQLMKVSEKDMEKAKQKGMTKVVLGSFLGTLVMAGVLAWLLDMAGVTVINGLLFSFMVWLGFFATEQMGMVFWENKPWSLYMLQTAHSLVSLLIVGAIIGAWA